MRGFFALSSFDSLLLAASHLAQDTTSKLYQPVEKLQVLGAKKIRSPLEHR
jgi:hypothetical protein